MTRQTTIVVIGSLRVKYLLLTDPGRFLCCSFSLFLRLWFKMLRLFCPSLFLISASVGASGGLCFVIVAFY